MAPSAKPEPGPPASNNAAPGRPSVVDTLRAQPLLTVLRLVWLVAPWTIGALLGEALHDRSDAVRTTGTLLAWTLWAGTLIALLVPRPGTLTLTRTSIPAALAAALWAVVATNADGTAALGAAAAVVAAALVLSPLVGDTFADGASYGDERRMLLRPPVAVLLGPLPLSWALCVAGVLAGPLLLAARQWVLGGVALVAGVPVALLALRSMHQLTQRWVVFVPAGFVLHDHLALAEPSLFQRRHVRSFGPAPAGSTAADFTMGAAGLALEVDLVEPQEINVVLGRRRAEVRSLGACLFTPSRPGAVMREATQRGLPHL